MRIRSEQLPQELTKTPNWNALLVAGDEPCLTIEALDLMRGFLKNQGFLEREIFDIDARFNWEFFLESTQTLSLFATQKIIELRFANKPDAKAQKQLIDYFANPSADLFILISTPKLDGNSLKSKWVAMIDQFGAVMPLYPPEYRELPNWIGVRCRQKNLQLSADAILFLAEHNEGNLLAILQELDHLVLLYGRDSIDIEALQSVMTESAHFIAFDLSDALLLGDTARIYRIIEGLRAEGEPPTLVNWVLQKEIALLGSMLRQIAEGESMERALSSVWDKRKPLYRSALSRLNLQRWKALTLMVVQIDRAIKGQLKENPWNAILRTAFALSGRRLLALSAEV